MSWPNEGDGTTVSVVSKDHHHIASDLIVGKECNVTMKKKVYPAIVCAKG